MHKAVRLDPRRQIRDACLRLVEACEQYIADLHDQLQNSTAMHACKMDGIRQDKAAEHARLNKLIDSAYGKVNEDRNKKHRQFWRPGSSS